MEKRLWPSNRPTDPFFSLIRYEFSPNRSTTLHTHEYAEIALIESGNGRQVINGTTVPLKLGDIFLSRPRGRFRFFPDVRILEPLLGERRVLRSSEAPEAGAETGGCRMGGTLRALNAFTCGNAPLLRSTDAKETLRGGGLHIDHVVGAFQGGIVEIGDVG